MFFVKQLRRDLLIEPHLLGKNLSKHVRDRIMDELEGKCIGRHGYIIKIYDVKEENIEHGLIDIDTGALNITGVILIVVFNFMLSITYKPIINSLSLIHIYLRAQIHLIILSVYICIYIYLSIFFAFLLSLSLILSPLSFSLSRPSFFLPLFISSLFIPPSVLQCNLI